MSIVNIQALKQLGNVLWWPGQYAESGAYDDDGNKRGFLILPDGATVTPSGTFAVEKMKDGRNIWYFNGSTNYVSLTDHANYNVFENNFAICGWIRFTSVPSTTQTIISKRTDLNNFIHVSWVNTNQISIDGAYSGTINFYYLCPLTPSAGVWYHFAIVRSGDSCIMYINAISQTVTISQAFRNTTAIDAPLQIGKYYVSSDIFFNGSIKDLQIFKGRALTQDQIAAIMRETYIY